MKLLVTADPERVKCIRAKGKWDNATKTCTLPKEPTQKDPTITQPKIENEYD